LKKRSEIDEKYKWDLSKYCKDDDDFYVRLEKLKSNVCKFSKYENKLSNDDILFECLEFESKMSQEYCLVNLYCELNLLTDLKDEKYNAMSQDFSIFATMYAKAVDFIAVEVSKFSKQKLEDLANNEKFRNYSRYFKSVIREKRHVLSKKEERLISSMTEFLDGFSENYEKFTGADLKFENIKDSKGKEYELTLAKFGLYLESEDRVLRKNASETLAKTYEKYINFFANNYIYDVKQTCVFAKLRKYKSALSAALDNEEVDEKVYRLLIKKTRENIDLVEKYCNLKRKALGYETLAGYDLKAPIGKVSKTYTFEEAVEIVRNALSVLGEEYVALIDQAVKERWIDVYPNDAKRSGGFETEAYGANPVIFMNFEGSLDDVFTLAHELGHAIHSFYSMKNQPPQMAEYTIFIAEVASTVNEILVKYYLISQAESAAEKIAIYDKFLYLMDGAIFSQTMLAEFEEKVHACFENDEALTLKKLADTYFELAKFYNTSAIKTSESAKYGWAKSSHIYSSFYVYKYATGMIAACQIVKQLLNKKGYLKSYIDFLSSGASSDPISLLKIAECDLSDENTYDEAFALCREFAKKWTETQQSAFC